MGMEHVDTWIENIGGRDYVGARCDPEGQCRWIEVRDKDTGAPLVRMTRDPATPGCMFTIETSAPTHEAVLRWLVDFSAIWIS